MPCYCFGCLSSRGFIDDDICSAGRFVGFDAFLVRVCGSVSFLFLQATCCSALITWCVSHAFSHPAILVSVSRFCLRSRLGPSCLQPRRYVQHILAPNASHMHICLLTPWGPFSVIFWTCGAPWSS